MNETKLFIAEFLDYLKLEKGLATLTIKSYRVDLESFFEYIKKDVLEMEKDDIYEYIDYMKKEFKHNTVQRKVSSIKTFYKFMYMNRYIKKDPTNTVKSLKKQKRLPEVLDIDEFNRIIETYNNEPKNIRDKIILKLLIATGARVSEIVNLQIKDITDNEYKYIKVLGKGSKYRYIPIYNDIADEIRDYIENTRNLLVVNKKDYRLFPRATRELFYKSINEHAKMCGITKNVYPHMIRHSVATLLLKNGADIRVVQELLGHSSISTTQIYTHVEKSKLKSIYDQIGIGDDIDEKNN